MWPWRSPAEFSSTYTKEQQNTIFNPDDFIDNEYISKSEADIRFLNANQNLEKMFGSMVITGDETVTNQYVTGNSIISGNETITGTIKAGNDNNATGNEFKHQGIHGHVWLGDSVTDTTTTVLSKFTAGGNGYKNINLNGAITNINTNETSSSTQLNIGRDGSVHTTTIKGNVNLGDETNTGTVRALGSVTLGWAKPIDIRGSNVSINIEPNSGPTTVGNGTNAINLNSTNVIVGNDNTSSVTQIKGKTIAIGNTPSDGGIQIGRGGLTANASGGQTNTFVSTQNKIFNPRLCDAWGNLLGQNFNLNNPSHFVYNQNLTYENGVYSFPPTSTSKQLIFYLYTPSLLNTVACSLTFEFFYYIIQGKTDPTGGLIPTVSLPTQSKVIQACFTTLITKSTGIGTNIFTNFILTNTTNPFTSYNSTGTTGLAGMVANTTCTPFGISKAATDSDGRFKITISFPQMTQSTPSSSTQFVMSMGTSLRITNCNAQGSDPQVYPNNSAHSAAGNAYFSLS